MSIYKYNTYNNSNYSDHLKRSENIAAWMDASKKLHRWKCLQASQTQQHINYMETIKRQEQCKKIFVIIGGVTITVVCGWVIHKTIISPFLKWIK